MKNYKQCPNCWGYQEYDVIDCEQKENNKNNNNHLNKTLKQ